MPHATTGAGHGARTGARQSTRAARAAWVRTRLTMLRASVRLALPHGELLVLPRNCSVEQLGHAVLLSGSVTARAVPAATGSSRNPGGSSAPDAPVASGAASTLDGEAPGASAAASDDAAVADALRWLSGAGRHQRQSLLPWLWDVLSADDLRAAPGACGSALHAPLLCWLCALSLSLSLSLCVCVCSCLCPCVIAVRA